MSKMDSSPLLPNMAQKQQTPLSFENMTHMSQQQLMMPQGLWSIQESPAQVLKKVLWLSALMIFLPLTLYFLSKILLFEALLGLTSSDSYFYSAIVAIVAAHVVLIGFIFVALFDESENSKRKLH